MDVWRQSEETDLDKIASPHCCDEWAWGGKPAHRRNYEFLKNLCATHPTKLIKTGNRRTKMNLIILQVLTGLAVGGGLASGV